MRVHLSLSVSLCLSLSLSVSLCLSLSLSLSLSVSLFLFVFLCFTLCLSVFLYLSLSLSIFLHLSLYLSVSFCLSLSLSVSHFITIFFRCLLSNWGGHWWNQTMYIPLPIQRPDLHRMYHCQRPSACSLVLNQSWQWWKSYPLERLLGSLWPWMWKPADKI